LFGGYETAEASKWPGGFKKNDESGTYPEIVVEEASNHCPEASKPLRERKGHEFVEANGSFELYCP
jgi:hypothetical protein